MPYIQVYKMFACQMRQKIQKRCAEVSLGDEIFAQVPGIADLTHRPLTSQVTWYLLSEVAA